MAADTFPQSQERGVDMPPVDVRLLAGVPHFVAAGETVIDVREGDPSIQDAFRSVVGMVMEVFETAAAAVRSQRP